MKKWLPVKNKLQEAARKIPSNDEAESVAVNPVFHTSKRSTAMIQRVIQTNDMASK